MGGRLALEESEDRLAGLMRSLFFNGEACAWESMRRQKLRRVLEAQLRGRFPELGSFP